MPPPRQPPPDPFTTNTTASGLSTDVPSLRNRASQQSLRSNTSSSSARARQQRDYLAPSNLRRPTGRTTTDDVLADTESEREQETHRPRKQRNASPKPKEEPEFVIRRADGNYLQDCPMPEVTLGPEVENQARIDAHHADVARRYFTSGAHMPGRVSKQVAAEFEQERPAIVKRLREEVMQKLERERWMFEPTNKYRSGRRPY